MLSIIIELVPIVIFFTTYKLGFNLKEAALVMTLAYFLIILLNYFFKKKLQIFSIISFIILLLSVLLSLLSGKSVFIKMKPTIVYFLLSCTFFITTLRKKPVIKYILRDRITISNKYLSILSYRFAIFFALMAIVNELVWRNFSESSWIKFKLFYVTPITLLFLVFQIPFIIKNKCSNE